MLRQRHESAGVVFRTGKGTGCLRSAGRDPILPVHGKSSGGCRELSVIGGRAGAYRVVKAKTS